MYLPVFATKNAAVILKLRPDKITMIDFARNYGDIYENNNAAPVVPNKIG